MKIIEQNLEQLMSYDYFSLKGNSVLNNEKILRIYLVPKLKRKYLHC